MRQTAVQFLGTKLTHINMSPKEIKDFLDWYEKAKEMEEHQIAEAHTAGFLAGENNVYRGGYVYYQETYKSK